MTPTREQVEAAERLTENHSALPHLIGIGGAHLEYLCSRCALTRAIAAALAQEAERVREVVSDLMKALDELMTEYVSKKRAANWGVINDAMVNGARLCSGGGKG